MAGVASYDDVKVNRIKRELPKGQGWRTNFLTYPEGTDMPKSRWAFWSRAIASA